MFIKCFCFLKWCIYTLGRNQKAWNQAGINVVRKYLNIQANLISLGHFAQNSFINLTVVMLQKGGLGKTTDMKIKASMILSFCVTNLFFKLKCYKSERMCETTESTHAWGVAPRSRVQEEEGAVTAMGSMKEVKDRQRLSLGKVGRRQKESCVL